MFREYFGISENPFSNTPDPNYLFMSQRHKEALAHLIYGVEGNSGFVLLTGEVGTGKTTLCRYLAERLPDNVELALCINPRLTEVELLANICDEMKIPIEGSRHSAKDLMDAINAYLLEVYAKGGRAVLIIDEAQNLGFNRLEQVRLLTNLETSDSKLLQVILIGQPELKEFLERPDLRQLSQRITARYHLNPMTRKEVKSYIAHRLVVAGLTPEIFGRGALNEISRTARGIPRLVNSICERCLLGAYAEGRRTIDAKLARAAAKEVLGSLPRGGGAALPVSLGLAAGVAAMAFLTLDPMGINLVPALSQSPRAEAVRDEVRTWPGVEHLFRRPAAESRR